MEEGAVNGKQRFVRDQHAAELTEPSVGVFNFPAPFLASKFPATLVSPLFVVLAVERVQLNASPFPSLQQRIGVVTAVGDHRHWLLPRPAFGSWDTDLLERGVRKRNFCRRGTFQPNSQRNTLTVYQYHPLCAFSGLGFTDCFAPFLAGAKLPSRKASSHFSKPFSSNTPSSARQALSQTPVSSHCFKRRQQVEGEGYSSGRKRHAAPVCRIHSMPSKQLRFGAGGRPRPSLRCFASGNRGPINSHCLFVNGFCRFFMTEAQQCTWLRRKYSL